MLIGEAVAELQDAHGDRSSQARLSPCRANRPVGWSYCRGRGPKHATDPKQQQQLEAAVYLLPASSCQQLVTSLQPLAMLVVVCRLVLPIAGLPLPSEHTSLHNIHV